MRHELPQDVTSLVKPASVHRSLYDDPAIFELELERIFGRAWIYVGHESQVREPGDYFCTQVGRKPIVVVRGPDKALYVLHNQCAHRGAMVVALDKGRTDEFQCCYHGWTYHLDGRLKAVPLQHGYPADFDPKSRIDGDAAGAAGVELSRLHLCQSVRRRTEPGELARLHGDLA